MQKIGALEEFFEIARTISSTLNLDTLLKKIGWAAERITDAEASSIILVDDTDKDYLYFKVASGEKGGMIKKLKIKIGEEIAGWVAKERKSVIVKDVKSDPRFTAHVDNMTGFVTRNILCVPMVVREELVGVVEVLNKKGGQDFTENDMEVLEGLSSFAGISVVNAKYAESQRNFFVNIIEILTNASEARDQRLLGHSWRITHRALAIAKVLGVNEKEYQDIYYAGLLHDIGYLSIGDRETREKNHPITGAEMVRGISSLTGAAALIRAHQERIDGSGTPAGIKGDQIPLGAKIIAVLEYIEEGIATGQNRNVLLEEIKNWAGIKFDAEVVKIYLEQVELES